MSQIVKNPTPKQRFQSNPKALTSHRDLIASDQFQQSTDFALLEFERQLSMVPFDNFNACAAAHLRKVGAHEFLSVLRNLAESSVPEAAKGDGNLNHRA